ncbi:response regulator transcription factor [Pedobacter puniceum]|jgi:DNA-binding response OmpR family regulator|uniref:Response regulator n=1 Tax=Pedobacter puniceum TaxID=2666136 RepID=A0A7K0FS23_9SPHI|nr:response regulator transcription factor [Pedobacter puniceum]MRX48808.1 response regulator [Pedobacter puniceum]
MNILIVEDEFDVLKVIKKALEQENYTVSVAMDGNTALKMCREHHFDVVLLDVMLPEKNGIEVCRRLRSEDYTVPILMLSALDSTENVVTGLDVGADDYLAKPFKLVELLARIKALLRRKQATLPKESNTIKIADLEFDTEARSVIRNGEAINLTATEYRLLEYFIKNKRKVLSRVDILENVWDVTYDLGTNVVDVYVNYLRKKIDKNATQKLIHTKVGMGYIFNDEYAF